MMAQVVGWGEENGVKFWNIRNSWGTYWGNLGFFKVERGINAIKMEEHDCWYADPDFSMEQVRQLPRDLLDLDSRLV